MATLKDIFTERCINVSSFARKNDIIQSTLYNLLNDQKDWKKLNVQTFRKIAAGLGMTSDELYEVLEEWDSEQ